MDERPCPKCEVKGVDEAYIRRCMDEIAPQSRVDAAEYERRLRVCNDCARLQNGVCIACGMFSVVRCLRCGAHCPYHLWP